MANGPFWPQYRTVVLSHRAQEFVDREEKQAPRFDDHWRGVEWLLARTPEAGVPRKRTSHQNHLVYVIPANQLAGTLEICVLYSYDQDEVQIHGAKFGPKDEE